MRVIRLTQASDTFSYEWKQHRGKSVLELRWDGPLDLKCAAKIRICSVQIRAFWAHEDLLVPLYCNLIDTSTFNPLREVFRVVVETTSIVINESCSGKQTVNYPYCNTSRVALM